MPQHFVALRTAAAILRVNRGHRLLTLTGPGGSGKTRLALAVASEVVDAFDKGVWLVELAPLSGPHLVPQAVASAERLKESFGLLSGGDRSAMVHHRTLRATMDWSHDLLSEEERILFRRLSVLAGGFTLEERARQPEGVLGLEPRGGARRNGLAIGRGPVLVLVPLRLLQ